MLNYGGGNMTSFFRVFRCGMWYENTGMPEYIQILQKYNFLYNTHYVIVRPNFVVLFAKFEIESSQQKLGIIILLSLNI